MTELQAFSLINLIPLIGWLALAFAPLRRGALIAVARGAAVSVAVAYVVMIAAAFGRPGPPVDMMTLPGLAHAFSDPRVMLIGWAHYLALDLWTGAWEAQDAGERGVPHWALLPCLVFTFLAGPVGLLLHLAVRTGRRGRPQAAGALPQ